MAERSESDFLSFDVIESAVNGDSLAIAKVLDEFSGSIHYHALTWVKDEEGYKENYDLKNFLLSKLMAGILKFEFR